MMRYLIILWAAPLVLFWGWYGLSANDLNFGTLFLSRELHDLVFQIYGKTLGMDADEIPPLLASGTVIDSGIVAAIAAFRWRASWWPATRKWFAAQAHGMMGGDQAAGEETPATGAKPLALPPGSEMSFEFRTAPYGPAHPAE